MTTLEGPKSGEKRTTGDPKARALLDLLVSMLDDDNKITAESLTPGARGLTWYEPSIINAEESRTNTAFGTLATPDEVKEVALASNALMLIGYFARAKSSVSGAGSAVLLLNGVELWGTDGALATQAATRGTGFTTIHSGPAGLVSSEGPSPSPVSTGQIIGDSVTGVGGFTLVSAAAGTYDVSVEYAASSGSVTARDRKLWVMTLG